MSQTKNQDFKIINPNPLSNKNVQNYIKKQVLVAQKKVNKLEKEINQLLKKES